MGATMLFCVVYFPNPANTVYGPFYTKADAEKWITENTIDPENYRVWVCKTDPMAKGLPVPWAGFPLLMGVHRMRGYIFYEGRAEHWPNLWYAVALQAGFQIQFRSNEGWRARLQYLLMALPESDIIANWDKIGDSFHWKNVV